MSTTLTPTATDDRKLRQAVQRLTTLPAGTAPSRDMLTDLLDGWGPDPLAPDINFLEEVSRGAVLTGRSILECGAGPTTVMLAALAGRRGVKVCTLEQSPPQRERVTRVAQQLGLSINVFEGSANYGRFIWYDPPFTRLPSQLWPMSAVAAPQPIRAA